MVDALTANRPKWMLSENYTSFVREQGFITKDEAAALKAKIETSPEATVASAGLQILGLLRAFL